MINDAMKDIVVTNITFGDAAVEIAYLEKKDQGANSGLIKTIFVANTLVQSELEDALDSIADMVDKGLLDIRNPEQSLDPRKRIKAKAVDYDDVNEPVDSEGEDELEE